MSDSNTSTQRPFADTALGKIVVGLVVAAGSAFIAWFVSRATYEPPPTPRPDAKIAPTSVLAQANEVVEFTAQGSSVPSSEAPTYFWSVGGLDLNKSPVARCTDRGTTIGCRFILPGTFAVSVRVLDANGQPSSAAASVTVSIPSGYLGVLLGKDDPNALRALLYDVDWVSLQALVARPIVLQDPETGAPIYAALVEPPAAMAANPPWRGAATGLKVAIPRLPSDVQAEFEVALAQIGMVPVTLPLGEIFEATERGAVDLGFIAVDSPEALTEMAGNR